MCLTDRQSEAVFIALNRGSCKDRIQPSTNEAVTRRDRQSDPSTDDEVVVVEKSLLADLDRSNAARHGAEIALADHSSIAREPLLAA